MSLWIKLCGVSTIADVETAIGAGANAIGIVLSPSPRQVDLETAQRLRDAASGNITSVAVFYHPTTAEVLTAHERVGFDLYQAEPGSLPAGSDLVTLPVVHDSFDIASEIKAARHLSTSGMVLVEGPGKGGHGEAADRSRLAALPNTGDVVLAGGLTAGEVGNVVRELELAGVDVSSGIERFPGVKDYVMMRRFVEAVREAEKELEHEPSHG